MMYSQDIAHLQRKVNKAKSQGGTKEISLLNYANKILAQTWPQNLCYT